MEIRALRPGEFDRFLAWRGGDAYKNEVITAEWAEHLAGLRLILVASDGDDFAGTVAFATSR